MGYWVRFSKTDTGVPDGYSGSWFEGAEWIEDVTSDQLDACRREPGGDWVLRDLVKVVPLTASEIAAAQEEVYQADLATRDAAIDAAILASTVYRSFIRGGMTLTAYRDAAAEIAAQFPMPER